MEVKLSRDDIVPIVEAAVAATLERIEGDRAKLNGQLAYTEAQAAALLNVQRHVLRDCRLRGEIAGVKVGARIQYERGELLAFLERNRTNGNSQ